MKKYEKPTVNVIMFEVKEKIMDDDFDLALANEDASLGGEVVPDRPIFGN